MNPTPQGTPDRTSQVTRAEQVDHLCDAFETAWLEDQQPRIEDFLTRTAPEFRTQLLHELLVAELDLRLQAGQTPDRERYVSRFPECAHLIDEFLAGNRSGLHDEAEAMTTPSGDATPPIPPPESFPGFTIKRELHRGGQGIVYQALQTSTKRKVALKVMLEGPFAGQDSRRRFEREIELVGSLRHPGIVPIYDSGVAGGRCYYVMEYVRGQPLTKSVASRTLDLRQTLHLFARVCDAVNYAHQRGVIHRDLKPSNILVDDRGDPHVLDFGLAKIAGAEANPQSLISVTGQVVGTPAYMSPEQAAGRSDEVDMRSDVYALGVILYELVTGQPPYEVSGSLGEVLQTIQHAEPRRPSLTGRHVNSEVETIVLKALDKDKQRRYDTAGALGRDIRRFLNGEPIEAKRDSMAYMLRKAISRYRVPAIIAASFLVLIVAASVGLSLLYYRAEAARVIAEQAEADAVDAKSDAEAARNLAVESSEDYRRLLYLSDMEAAQQSFLGQDIRNAVSLLQRHFPHEGQTDLRQFEWFYLWGRCQRSRDTPTCLIGEALRDRPFVVKISRDGRTLAVGTNGPFLELWDIGSPQHPRRRLRRESNLDAYTALAFSPDGRWLAAGVNRRHFHSVDLWDVARGELVQELTGHRDGLVIAAFSADGTSLVTVDRQGEVKTWDPKTGKQSAKIISLELPQPLTDDYRYAWHQAVLSLEHGLIAIGTEGKEPVTDQAGTVRSGGAVVIWDLETGRRRHAPLMHGARVTGLALSPDGRSLLSAGRGIKIWDVATGEFVRSMAPDATLQEFHEREITDMTFLADGKTLVTGSYDATVKLWDFTTGDLLDTLRGHDKSVTSVDVSRDGKWLVSGASERTARLWDLDEIWHPRRPKPEQVFGIHSDDVFQIRFSPAGNTVASEAAGVVKVWDAISGSVHYEFDGLGALAFSPDGQHLAAISAENEITIRDAVTGAALHQLRLEGDRFTALAYSPDGKTLASTTGSRSVKFWDVQTGDIVGELSELTDWLKPEFRTDSVFVGFLPATEAPKLVTVIGPSLTVWDRDQGTAILKHTLPYDRHCVAVSHDGSMIAIGRSGGDDFSIISSRTGEVLKVFGKQSKSVGSNSQIAWSPDGKMILTGGYSGQLTLWNVDTGELQFNFDRTRHGAWCVDFSPNGQTIAVGSNKITLYSAVPGRNSGNKSSMTSVVAP